jgi:hypothetical protein
MCYTVITMVTQSYLIVSSPPQFKLKAEPIVREREREREQSCLFHSLSSLSISPLFLSPWVRSSALLVWIWRDLLLYVWDVKWYWKEEPLVWLSFPPLAPQVRLTSMNKHEVSTSVNCLGVISCSCVWLEPNSSRVPPLASVLKSVVQGQNGKGQGIELWTYRIVNLIFLLWVLL